MNEKMEKWFRDLPPDKLLEMRLGHPPHSSEYRMADEEIHRRESAESKKQSEQSDKIEAQRHGDSIGLGQEAIRENRRANVLSVRAMWISGLSLLCSVVIPLALHDCESGIPYQSIVTPPLAQVSNLPPVIASPLTNALATNTPATLRTPKP
jgi:hypothetical protein